MCSEASELEDREIDPTVLNPGMIQQEPV